MSEIRSVRNGALGLAARKGSGFLVPLLIALLLVSFLAPPASAQPARIPFAATFTGDFAIAGDIGKSVLFVVAESGKGTEETFGAFTYVVSAPQNLARVPAGCGPFSSTGVAGAAVLTFTDGELALYRTAGTACFSFPTITLAEQWVIASGTGRYVGATGKLSRQLVGDVTDGTVSGTLDGSIQVR